MRVKHRLTQPVSGAANIVNFLNNSRTPEDQRTKVASLVRDLAALKLKPSPKMDMRRARKLIDSDSCLYGEIDLKVIYRRSGVREDEAIETLNEEDAAVAERIKGALSDYVFVPELNLARWGRKPQVCLQTRPDDMKTTDRLDVLFRGCKCDEDSPLIVRVIFAVSELAKVGGIGRVRQCRCQKWFFASRRNKWVCTVKCRKAAYESTLKRRNARRGYMRDYMRQYRAESKQGLINKLL